MKRTLPLGSLGVNRISMLSWLPRDAMDGAYLKHCAGIDNPRPRCMAHHTPSTITIRRARTASAAE